MKKLLLLILFPFILNSCSSDNDEYSYSESDLIGTWVLETKKAKAVKTSNSEGNKVIKKDIIRNKSKEIYTFIPGGKVIILNGENSQSGTYSLKDDTLTIDKSEEKYSIKIDLLNNNTISYDINETEYYAERIEALLKAKEEEEERDVEDAVVIRVITTYTYKRKELQQP